MKSTRLAFLLFMIPAFLISQEARDYLQKADDLIVKKEYAAASQLLESSIRTLGFQGQIIIKMTDNVLQHFFLQRDFEIFYLRNASDIRLKTDSSDSNPAAVAFRYPDRWLKKVIDNDPQSAGAYKLLGDYYDLKLSHILDSDLAAVEKVVIARDLVLENYLRAVQLGFSDPDVNLWLGKHYLDANQLMLARQYLLANAAQEFEHPQTRCYLAEIHYREKKYTQCLTDAQKALEGEQALSLTEKYNAYRLAALSFYHLDEGGQFLANIQHCLDIFPDHQDAYIDLLTYYDENKLTAESHALIREMLMYNPYDIAGYKYLEQRSVKQNDYHFGEKLFEEMMLRFEHSDQVMGNIYRFRGNLFFFQGYTEQAKAQWDISRKYFSRYLPEDSIELKEIGDISRESSLR